MGDYRYDMRVTGFIQPGDLRGLAVRRFTVSEEAAKLARLRSAFGFGSGSTLIQAGEYTKLVVDGHLWMSDAPDEINDHYQPYRRARGHVLINGLGLGCLLRGVLLNAAVEHVDVVELDERVIEYIGGHFRDDPRVTLHHGDAYQFSWPKGATWDVAWHDIWPSICEDNLEGMQRLHRRYGRRVGWQGSWKRDEIEARRRR